MKILLIGNKTDIPDKTDAIKELAPDMVIRINKCDSWEKTKTAKTDIWLMDIYNESLVNDYRKIPDECLDTMDHKMFFIENSLNVSLYTILEFSKLQNLHIMSMTNSTPIKKYFFEYDWSEYRPSNFMWMVIYCLENLNGDVYVTACDIEDRSYLKENIYHAEAYKEEERILKEFVAEARIHII